VPLDPFGKLRVDGEQGRTVDQARAVMIMVHGRNATPHDILDLVPHLDRPGFAYLAPAAANHTWYPYGFMTETAKNEPYLSSALGVLERLVEDVVSRGFEHRQIALLGFSQGACLSAELAVRHARRYGGVIIYSGGLIGPPGTSWNYPGSFDGTPVFLGCSDIDPHIPKARVDETAAVFERMGAGVTTRIYPGMGHVVNDDEIDVARQIMHGMLA
jgi:predicted esterase